MIKFNNVKILTCDTPLSDGIVFSSAVVGDAIKSIDKVVGKMYDYDDWSYEVSLAETSHYVDNLRIVDGCLVGDLTILDTPNGNTLQEILSTGNFCINPRLRSFGYDVSFHGYVSNFTISRIDVELVGAGITEKIMNFLKKTAKKFGRFKKKLYLCITNKKKE